MNPAKRRPKRLASFDGFQRNSGPHRVSDFGGPTGAVVPLARHIKLSMKIRIETDAN